MQSQQFKRTGNYLWDERYKTDGHLWGDQPSTTGKIVSDLASTKSEIFEFAYGYGRDTIYLSELGHIVAGIEKSQIGYNETTREIQNRDLPHHGLQCGDFVSMPHRKDGYDIVFHHRFMHLLQDKTVLKLLVKYTAEMLKPNGYLCVSVRDERDFNSSQMKRNVDGTVEYVIPNRKGHVIELYNEEKLTHLFSDNFEILEFCQNSEIESVKNQVPTHFTTMIARRNVE